MKRSIVEIDEKIYNWDTIVSYMDDEKREKVHFELDADFHAFIAPSLGCIER